MHKCEKSRITLDNQPKLCYWINMARKTVLPGPRPSTILKNICDKLPDPADSTSVCAPLIAPYVEAKLSLVDFDLETFISQYPGIPLNTFKGYLHRHPEIDESILNASRKRWHAWAILVDQALVRQALKGDPRAIDLFYRRFEGWCLPGEAGQKIIIMINPQLGSGASIEVKRTKVQEISGSDAELDAISAKSPEVIDIKED